MTAFIFALSQLLIIFSPKLDVYSCLGKQGTSHVMGSCFLMSAYYQWKTSAPELQQGTELVASVVAPICKPLTAFQSAIFGFVDFSPLFNM